MSIANSINPSPNFRELILSPKKIKEKFNFNLPVAIATNIASEEDNKSNDRKLSPKDIVPIGLNNTNSWNKRTLVLCEKTRRKYNIATCTALDINKVGVKSLNNIYHKINGLPGFVHRFLQGKPSLARALFVQSPEIYPIFDTPCDNSKTLLMLNPEYLDENQFLANCKKMSTSYALQQLKYSKNGLALVTWYIHPEALPLKFRSDLSPQQVLKNYRKELMHEAQLVCKQVAGEKAFSLYRYGIKMSPLTRYGSFSKLPRTTSQEQISALEVKGNNVYLASLFDLDKNKERSLIYLKSLRNNILSNLERVYGVTSEDKIKIYLHMPYLEPTTTLHVHIRINQADHALEDSKSFGLNEIINTLEKNGSVEDMILNRGTIYCSEYPIGKNAEGVSVKTVPNFKRDWKDIFLLLNTPKVLMDYLIAAVKCSVINNRMQLLDIDQIDRLVQILKAGKTLPQIEELVEILKKMEINIELKELGWSLETGTCSNEEQRCSLSGGGI